MRFRSAQERKKDSIESGLHLSHDEDDDDDDDTDYAISLVILHSMLAQVWSQANKLGERNEVNLLKTKTKRSWDKTDYLQQKTKLPICLQQQTKLSIAYNKKQNYRLLTLTRNKTTDYLQLQRQPKLVLQGSTRLEKTTESLLQQQKQDGLLVRTKDDSSLRNRKKREKRK